MLGEPKNQFSLTRAALSTGGRAKSDFLLVSLRQPVPTLDAFLAATALVHDLTVVSRDEDGFRNTGVRLINPFSKSKPTGN